MIRINCPVCGLRSETEFTYGADATVRRPDHDEAELQPWVDYVFNRDNRAGRTRNIGTMCRAVANGWCCSEIR